MIRNLISLVHNFINSEKLERTEAEPGTRVVLVGFMPFSKDKDINLVLYQTVTEEQNNSSDSLTQST